MPWEAVGDNGELPDSDFYASVRLFRSRAGRVTRVEIDGPPAVVGGGRVMLLHNGPLTDLPPTLLGGLDPNTITRRNAAGVDEPHPVLARPTSFVPWTPAQLVEIEDRNRADRLVIFTTELQRQWIDAVWIDGLETEDSLVARMRVGKREAADRTVLLSELADVGRRRVRR